ncbi:MAG TPA: cobalamin-dependent protein [Dissulfurispiraceae bacterium]|nr:cobalamin-dependent protein [Dissulfurispiraceae bacterium]
MKVLLINPNRFRTPPVPPIGLEYIAESLRNAGDAAEVLDLCFIGEPRSAVDDAIATVRPELVGITVRNVDSVLYHSNEFFLDDIRELVTHIRTEHALKVVTGGAGIRSNPQGILDYLGADFAIVGPAEGNAPACLSAIHRGLSTTRVFRGMFDPEGRPSRRFSPMDYGRYFDEGGIAGFETHKGCSSSCVYCLEADTPVIFKNIADVVCEIRRLADAGFTHFHLCDSEFNEDLDFSIEFCAALRASGIRIRWAAYMKPANFNRKLLSLMRETGAYLITLTVDSFRKCPEYWADVEKLVFLAKSAGIKIAVDFLTGFPQEDDELLKWCLDLFGRLQPDSVNINTYLRLYRSLRIAGIIMSDPESRSRLLGNAHDSSLITPVFYNRLSSEQIRELTGEDPLFRIEGLTQGVNYLRV